MIIQENSDALMRNRLLQKRKEKPNANLIVIGGNVISRGLTLQNLLVSYFGRASSQADTIYQMGRWFGYRKKYIELTKLYMTSESISHFNDQANIDQDLREKLRGLTKQAKKTGRKSIILFQQV